PRRLWWQRFGLTKCIRHEKCHVLFSPGGSLISSFRPAVTMSRNLLPFDASAQRKEGISVLRVKLWVLRKIQLTSFRKANAVIFLTQFAYDSVRGAARGKLSRATVIPHGLSRAF